LLRIELFQVFINFCNVRKLLSLLNHSRILSNLLLHHWHSVLHLQRVTDHILHGLLGLLKCKCSLLCGLCTQDLVVDVLRLSDERLSGLLF
jgi:hypothetical protein